MRARATFSGESGIGSGQTRSGGRLRLRCRFGSRICSTSLRRYRVPVPGTRQPGGRLRYRLLNGTYVSVEPFHLFRYLDEQSYRFNERKCTDKERFLNAIRGVIGKRLSYKELVGKLRGPKNEKPMFDGFPPVEPQGSLRPVKHA